MCTVVLNEIDAQCHLSEKLKYAIRDGLKRQQELDKWKRENMTPFMYVLNTPPVI
ncbi:inner membrane protein yafU [Shigella sonnei 53G]|nr:inner membrane protein yafU [Shigella sonnei 53G]